MMKMKNAAAVEFVEFDLPWLAGFFDGAGSVGVYSRNYNRSKTTKYFVLVVSFGQTGPLGKMVLEECCKRWGGSCYQNKTNKSQTLNKIMWKWNVSADKAVNFLEEILPHSFIKREQILLGLTFQKLPSKLETNQQAAKLAELITDLKQ